ncbi:hypothetical protein DsansV1_C09g0091771 [Dioscorea sansibarensis]
MLELSSWPLKVVLCPMGIRGVDREATWVAFGPHGSCMVQAENHDARWSWLKAMRALYSNMHCSHTVVKYPSKEKNWQRSDYTVD